MRKLNGASSLNKPALYQTLGSFSDSVTFQEETNITVHFSRNISCTLEYPVSGNWETAEGIGFYSHLNHAKPTEYGTDYLASNPLQK